MYVKSPSKGFCEHKYKYSFGTIRLNLVVCKFHLMAVFSPRRSPCWARLVENANIMRLLGAARAEASRRGGSLPLTPQAPPRNCKIKADSSVFFYSFAVNARRPEILLPLATALATCLPTACQLPVACLLAACRPLTDRLPTAYQLPGDRLSTACRLLVGRLSAACLSRFFPRIPLFPPSSMQRKSP